LDTDLFQTRLASLEPAVRAFAAERLAAPVHESLEVAKAQASRAAEALRTLRLSEATKEIVDSQKNDGDFESHLALAAEVDQRLRAIRGDAPKARPSALTAPASPVAEAVAPQSSKNFRPDTGPKAEPEY